MNARHSRNGGRSNTHRAYSGARPECLPGRSYASRQAAKTTLFDAGNEADVRKKRRRRLFSNKATLVANRSTRAVIHALAQVLARLEVRDVLAGQRHRFPGLRIAPLARRPEMQRKAAEAANLDALPGRESVTHDFQD